ncbi:MAG: DHHA1 domain-containing protein, partial [Ilumatobacteraceae bacterium]
DIGIIKITSESSIGANLRRIEAVAGMRTLHVARAAEEALIGASRLVGASVDDVVSGITKKLDEIKSLTDENKVLRSKLATGRASEIAASALGGIVITRVDELSPGDLRDLALAVRQQPNVEVVVLGGVSSTGGVTLVAAVQPGSTTPAADLIRDAAKAVGGGGGGKGDVATAGGKNPAGLDEALRLAREAAGIR